MQDSHDHYSFHAELAMRLLEVMQGESTERQGVVSK